MDIISIFQIILSVAIVVVIVFQNRGADSGITFGGGTQSYRSKKGLEKFLFYLTIGLVALFACISILSVII